MKPTFIYINWHDIVATYIIILVTRNLYMSLYTSQKELKIKRFNSSYLKRLMDMNLKFCEVWFLWEMYYMILKYEYLHEYIHNIYTLTYSHIQKLNYIWRSDKTLYYRQSRFLIFSIISNPLFNFKTIFYWFSEEFYWMDYTGLKL